ncbi:LytTR family two component transcriptional regulator [Aquimarina sp. MAR_2010_214]|uniref:LytR/AlgR family response regulator transcription factor n=1 Tax=Aquimarina sp. MAR_2010_214 TaxID=1250026 RepID=UPI000C713074|nr:LytTR family DNA-binding domain-containing protein [Aquimarina sp. MAR_2010_214]PKV51044.1 LytTR family two component transcriptional regulator [Aquimarina sp. MAR_2010_214]
MKISTLIIDDEPLARKLIANLLISISEIEVVGHCKTGQQAILMINEMYPDLIFLDIQLKDMTGFDVLEKITSKVPLVIFVSAFDSFAIKAFDFFAFDYLLKPYKEERFYRSVHRVIDIFKKDETVNLEKKINALLKHVKPIDYSSHKRKIPVSLGNKTLFVSPYNIQYIIASNYYVEIYTDKTKYVLRESMYNLLNKLDNKEFIRIHRSTIINIECIKELINFNRGEISVKMKDLKQLKVSRSYKKEFLIKMGL